MNKKGLTKRTSLIVIAVFTVMVFLGSFFSLGKWEVTSHLSLTDRYYTAFCLTVLVMAVVCTLGTIISALIVDKNEKE